MYHTPFLPKPHLNLAITSKKFVFQQYMAWIWQVQICWQLDKEEFVIFSCVQLKMVLIKCCDISNEVRPTEVAEPWVDCLLEEYFIQVCWLYILCYNCSTLTGGFVYTVLSLFRAIERNLRGFRWHPSWTETKSPSPQPRLASLNLFSSPCLKLSWR